MDRISRREQDEEPLPENPGDDKPPDKSQNEGSKKEGGDSDVDKEKEKESKEKGKEEEKGDRKEYRAGNCNDCNRQFCIDYNLPICKGAGMEDVFTQCFRTFWISTLLPSYLFSYALVPLSVFLYLFLRSSCLDYRALKLIFGWV